MTINTGTETIRELKNKIGNAAEYIIASELNIERKNGMYKCPNNHAHNNGDKNPSMSWDSERYTMKCFRCDTEIDLYDLFTKYKGYDHNEAITKMGWEGKSKKETFSDSIKNLKGATINVKKFFISRGWTEQTIKDMKVCSYSEFGKEKVAYVYFDKELKPDAVKLRNLDVNCEKKYRFTSISGSDFHFYNKHNVTENETLVITEGEADCGLVWQSGIRNVVSIGCGAKSLNKMLEQEKKYIEKFNNLIIASDNDEAGNDMDEIFLTVYPQKTKTMNKELYLGCKDITELYLKHGEKAVIDLVESAKEKIEGEYNPDDDTYENIIKVNTGKFIPIGMPRIDSALNQLRPGYVTLITGRSNDGKSTFVNQVIANAIENNAKVYWVSGEEVKEDLMDNFRRLLIGHDHKYYTVVRENLDYIKKPIEEVWKAITEWHKGKLKIFVKGDSKLKTSDQLLDMIEKRVKSDKYNLVVIDNLMSVLSAKAAEKWVAQSDFMQRLHDIASINKCHIILVLHPTKEVKKGERMDFEGISGAGELSQKADNIIAVRKSHDEAKEKEGISGYVEILKNRKKPFCIEVETNFDIETGFLNEYDSKTGKKVMYKFSWDKYLHDNMKIDGRYLKAIGK